MSMTEEESILVNQISNEYWTEFSKLVAKHLSRVPRHLQDELLMILQEHSSCYGSNYEEHMQCKTPLMEN